MPRVGYMGFAVFCFSRVEFLIDNQNVGILLEIQFLSAVKRGGLNVVEIGYVVKKIHTHRVIINMAAIVGNAVAHNEIVGSEYTVIGIDLLKNSLGYGYMWCLIFNNYLRTSALFVVENGVATSRSATDSN